MSSMLTTPVALIIFNRPETTARVFAEIARARPAKLLVIADGPRVDHPEDVEKCAATRAIIERVDWPCEVLTNFSEANLGCKMRPVSGLNWVFENVEEAIILEDDCLPHPTFFRFCEELLERYRDDERVMMVGGINLLGEWQTGTQSYFFSALGGTWGWATWRRAWRYFDPEIKTWPEALESQVVEDLFPNARYSSYWKEIFQKVYDGTIESAWDYQWLLACWLQKGWRIVPQANLVKNIGFGAGATHHQSADHPFASMSAREISFPLNHPSVIERDWKLDEELSRAFFSTRNSMGFLYRLKARVSRTLSESR
jgi:hypothetical protein